MLVMGFAAKYGDNINTDMIIPGKYLVYTDPNILGQHAMESIDPGFVDKAKNGVIIVAGHNFGSGSSREQAPIALKYSGTRCAVAKSFARIFFRNAINIGLPVLECEPLADLVDEGDLLKIDLEHGIVEDQTKRNYTYTQPLPEFIIDLIRSGGLLNKLKRMYGNNAKL